MSELIDTFGRKHKTLRISVTDRCQLRCSYCMPLGNPNLFAKENILSFEEIAMVVQIAAELGIQRIRITGGEPLLRHELHKLISLINKIKGIESIAMTTNGLLLRDKLDSLTESGLNKISISLDTLDPIKFANLSKSDSLTDVIDSIDYAVSKPNLKVSLNSIAMRNLTEQEIIPLIEFALSRKIFVRFIELMPFESINWNSSKSLTAGEILKIVEEHFGAEVFEEINKERFAASARLFKIQDGEGGFGFIASLSNPFCMSCDRLRLRADGTLFNCLFSRIGFELRPAVKNNNEEEIRKLIQKAVAMKEKGGMEEFACSPFSPSRIMSSIGG